MTNKKETPAGPVNSRGGSDADFHALPGDPIIYGHLHWYGRSNGFNYALEGGDTLPRDTTIELLFSLPDARKLKNGKTARVCPECLKAAKLRIRIARAHALEEDDDIIDELVDSLNEVLAAPHSGFEDHGTEPS